MTSVYVNPTFDDEERRQHLYAGDIVVLPATEASLALVDFAAEMLIEAFAPVEPALAQYEMPVERFVEIFAPVKPSFIHHPRTKDLVADMVDAYGCDPELTYIDVPRLRGVTSDGYLTSGVGYAHHPHRDTWYSAPMQQLNWWLPIWDFTAESSMDFHPRYFSEGVANGSDEFNYYEWNKVGRASAASQIKSDTRKQPKAVDELELEPALRLVCPRGGVILFSGAQLHSTVPNTSGRARFSMDLRTVNYDDVVSGRGAPNVDSHPTGTSLRDFMRARDLERLPEDVVSAYDIGGGVDGGVLVFQPETAS